MKPTVLIADDEPDLRRILEFVLRREGFSVLAASDGMEAIALYREHPEVGLVLLDLMMPRLDGLATLRELRRLNPSLPCWLCSGVADSLAPDEIAGHGEVPFFRKPLPLDEIVRTLHTVAS